MGEESDKKGPVLKIKASNPSNGSEEHAYHICNKGFISRKALGGHMRIHASPNDTEQLYDLYASLPPGWAVTARRGRKRLTSCKSPPLLPGIDLRILKPVVELYSMVCINLHRRDRSNEVKGDEINDKIKKSG